MVVFKQLRSDQGSASILIVRVITGVVAALVVTTMESHILSHLFGQATALLPAGISR